MIGRRFFLVTSGAWLASHASASDRRRIVVYRDPFCGCCDAWVEHVVAAGFSADVRIEQDMNLVKARLGVPMALASCHTSVVEGFVIEGHVPAQDIERLLRERPPWSGIAVPGMPLGSPGMETADQARDAFQVIAFGRGNLTAPYARYPRGFGG